MAARILMMVSAGIILLLGTLHLIYTFSGPKLLPRDPDVVAAMQRDHMRITRETTVWRAWIGFNASHSMAGMLFGLIFGYLAAAHPELLFGSVFLLAVGFAMVGGLCILAKLYWFSVPFTGVMISLICYVASVAVW